MTVKSAISIVAYVLALALLLTLGTWQVSRGLHKADVLSLVEAEHKKKQLLQSLPENPESLNYQTASLAGKWIPKKFFLLDNRIYQGQAGYEVLTPFQLPNQQTLLINRGWIPKAQANAIPLPSSKPPAGMLYLPNKGYTIGESIKAQQAKSDTWPKTSLYMDLEAFADSLQTSLSPLVLVLDPNHSDSFRRIWKPLVITPERHYGYAVQWYGLALVFVVFGVIWYRRSRKST